MGAYRSALPLNSDPPPALSTSATLAQLGVSGLATWMNASRNWRSVASSQVTGMMDDGWL